MGDSGHSDDRRAVGSFAIDALSTRSPVNIEPALARVESFLQQVGHAGIKRFKAVGAGTGTDLRLAFTIFTLQFTLQTGGNLSHKLRDYCHFSLNKRTPNQARQLCGIAVIGRNGRMNHFRLGDAGPVNRMPGLQGKLRNEFALRPAIPFSKGMQHIDFAQVMPRSTAKPISIKPVQMLLLGKLPK